ncbi:MAG: diaminopimelate decarboxylase, partial [Oscillospiraceae bacterium]
RLEVCSPGELCICERLNIDMDKIVFSGVNKTQEDICQASTNNVGIYTAESLKHLQLINDAGIKKGTKLPLLLRLTSGNQFGMDEKSIKQIIKDSPQYKGVELIGIHYFSGTQKKRTAEIEDELNYLDSFCDELNNELSFKVKKLEYGSGLPVPYFTNEDFTHTLLPLKAIAPKLKSLCAKYDITMEMGIFFVADCVFYLTQVADIKQNKEINYCIIDGGINHISYYGQALAMKVPVIEHLKNSQEEDFKDYTICGSLCTTADVLVRKFAFSDLEIGDILAFSNMGAYSVTEGIYLFLSRKMPRVVLYSEENGAVLQRDYIETHTINSL